MPAVKNLKIARQSGSDNTYYATWEFDETTKHTTVGSGALKAGSLVSIKSGATYYNGVSIPDWVMSDRWYLIEVIGDRAVLGKNVSGSNNIVSPINVKYLSDGSGTPTTTTINTLDHYAIAWFYDTDGIWFKSGETYKTDAKYTTFNAPANAYRILIHVTPSAKYYKVNGKEVQYWNGSMAQAEHYMLSDPPDKPSVPTVTVDDYKLTAELNNIPDKKADLIKFQVWDETRLHNSGKVSVWSTRAKFSCSINAGGLYRVRAQSICLFTGREVESEWSDYSAVVKSIPAAPAKIILCQATSSTSVRLTWSNVSSADTYDIEYTTKKDYFDGSDKTTTVTGIKGAQYEKTGLESGQEYFFRVRAVNDKGHSTWTGIKSVIIGRKPTAPTTWSSTTTVITGEPLTLYWVHNSRDESKSTYAELELTINGVKTVKTIKSPATSDDETEKTSTYPINTSTYTEGTVIKWRVRTAGVTKQYGDWSVLRTIDVYAPPTLSLSLTNKEGSPITNVTSFPFYISGFAGPKTQRPIGYHVSIKANQTYRALDEIGNLKIVSNGDEVYAKYFDTSDQLAVEFTPYIVDLENGVNYVLTVVVSMDSGLTAEKSLTFSVNWEELLYEPDAEIGVDDEVYSAYIRPYCNNTDGSPNLDVLLSVYRREFDGTFTEIATGIETNTNTYITDPHPALDYARYRIVATSKTTGTISYYDAPAYPVSGISVIIQWDAEWSNFNAQSSDEMAAPPWSGSMLKLPYNVDVSDSNNIDVALVEYIGRSHPVSYYGTQIGSSSTWNVVIPKNDEETLYALRRLSVWRGDAYVREPSGSGYWANVSVSFSQKHCDVTIPVTLDIKRVEGGM